MSLAESNLRHHHILQVSHMACTHQSHFMNDTEASMSAACITTHIWKYSSASDSLVCMVNCSLQFLLRAAELGLLHGGPPLVYESSSACCSWVTSARFTPLSGSQKAPKDPRTRRKKHNNSERVTDLKVKARRTPAIRMTATHQKHDHSGRCPCRTCRPLHPW